MPRNTRNDQHGRGRRAVSASARPRAGGDDSAAVPLLPSADWFAALRRAALRWFARNGRDLPWRQSSDPYAVLVSELMLQQTTVATVAPRWRQFLAAFPTVERLAQADVSEVLRAWEGLGYYRRAKQLHAAAQRIVADHAGQVPYDPAVLAELPGLGRYSASAVLCFACGQSLPIVEANTRRLWARLLGYRAEAESPAAERLFWAAAERIVRRSRNPRPLNLALMDLGALVCRPRQPQCDRCPLVAQCAAWRNRLQNVLPRKRAKAFLQQRHEAAVVIRRGRKVLLVRYGDKGQWSGLWDFPRVLLADGPPTAEMIGEQMEERLDSLLKEQTVGLTECSDNGLGGKRIRIERHLARWRHRVTHFQITLDCFAARWTARDDADGRNDGVDRCGARRSAEPASPKAIEIDDASQDAAQCRTKRKINDDTTRGRCKTPALRLPCQWAWVEREALADYPLPSTARRLAQLYYSAEKSSR